MNSSSSDNDELLISQSERLEEEDSEEEDDLSEWDIDKNPKHEFVNYDRGLDLGIIANFLQDGEKREDECIEFLNEYCCQVISNNSSSVSFRVLVMTEKKKIEWETWTKDKIMTSFKGFYINIEVTKEDRKGNMRTKTVKVDIPKAWLESLDRNWVKYVTYDPSQKGGIHGNEFLNLFTGFPFHNKYNPLPWMLRGNNPAHGDAREIIDIIENHIFEVICRSNLEIYRFVKLWMRMVRQHPEFRPEVYIICIGEEGSGKSVFWSRYAKVFGDNAEYLQEAKDVMQRFAGDHIDNKVLIVCDEADFNNKEYGPRLKNLVTSEKRRQEKKGKDCKQVTNYLNGVFTTNSRNCLPVSKTGKNRRYLAIEASDKYSDDKEYFDRLATKLSSPVGLAVFDFWLRKKKVEARRLVPPLTEELNNMKISGINKLQDWWLSKLGEGRTLTPQPGDLSEGEWLLHPVDFGTLYQQYNFSCRDSMNRGNFINKIKRILPVEGVDLELDYMKNATLPKLEICREYAYNKIGIRTKRKTISLKEKDVRKKSRQTTLDKFIR